MKYLIFSAALGGVLVTASAGHAVTVTALSFTTSESVFSVSGGSSPDGIEARATDFEFLTVGTDATLDDPAAVVAADTNFTQVGNAGPISPVPFIAERQFRLNRTDPTQFADAQYDYESQLTQDGGADVVFFSPGRQEVDRSGLAQLRLEDPLVSANALSSFGTRRTIEFENISNESITFDVGGSLNMSLLARAAGDTAIARTSAVISVLTEGLAADQITFLDTGGVGESINLIGTGASSGGGLSETSDGVVGTILSASATALGADGFAEASYNMSQLYRLRLTFDPGQIATIDLTYAQTNFVEYTTTTPPAVPLPAGAVLLGSAFAMFGLRRRLWPA